MPFNTPLQPAEDWIDPKLALESFEYLLNVDRFLGNSPELRRAVVGQVDTQQVSLLTPAT